MRGIVGEPGTACEISRSFPGFPSLRDLLNLNVRDAAWIPSV